MGYIFIGFLTQVLFSIGIILIFGTVIGFCNKKFYSNIGANGGAVCIATGLIGTPIHELSHALFCIIFRHKINEIKLFTIGDDGTLGYVNHSYNPKNLYQRIGNFFIGVAPILGITAVILLIAKFLLPDLPYEILDLSENFTPESGILGALYGILQALKIFFSYITDPKWWAFIVLGMLLSLHMTLSGADIKGAMDGLVALLALLLIVDIAIGLLSPSFFDDFVSIFFMIGAFLCSFMTVSLILSIIAVIISYIYRIISRR